MRNINRNYPAVIAALCDCWAIQEWKLAAIISLVEMRGNGMSFNHDDVGEQIDKQLERKAITTVISTANTLSGIKPVSGAVAVIPVLGTIAQRISMMTESSGGTSTERIGREIDEALANPSVGSIVLDIDSPGGSVYGVQELSDKIFSSRGSKPMYAVANSLAASAAYWLASSADQIIVTPSGEVGSIGVVAVHSDYSKAAESAGVKFSIIKAGRFKDEGNPYEPLGDQGRDALQGRVNEYYSSFVNSVARGRGVKAESVKTGFGEGRTVGAQEAVTTNMADKVGTLEQVIASLTRSRRSLTTSLRSANQGKSVALLKRRMELL